MSDKEEKATVEDEVAKEPVEEEHKDTVEEKPTEEKPIEDILKPTEDKPAEGAKGEGDEAPAESEAKVDEKDVKKLYNEWLSNQPPFKGDVEKPYEAQNGGNSEAVVDVNLSKISFDMN